MNEKFEQFLNEIPTQFRDFVAEVDHDLIEKGCRREIQTAKSGLVVSYSRPMSNQSLLNYVFRKTGVKMRIYAAGIEKYDSVLDTFPEKMKKEIQKASDCKKLNGGTCSPYCPGGYSFAMDGTTYQKCRSMAFFHSLDEESNRHILKLLQMELANQEKNTN